MIKRKIIQSLLLFLILSGCTTIKTTDIKSDRKVTEYYFGVVKIVSPAVYASNKSIRFLEVGNYGFWMSVDNRPYTEDMPGIGMGLGYRHIERQNLPLDCRIVINAKNQKELENTLGALNFSKEQKESLCVASY